MKRILIFRTGQLGDTLVVLPALHALRLQFADAEIVHLYDHHFGKSYVMSRALLEGSGLVDGFIRYSIGYSLKEKLLAALDKCSLLLKLRRHKFDMVIHLEPGMKTPRQRWRDWVFFRLAGIRKQISCSAFRRPVDRSNSFMVEHESDFFLRALRAQGIDVPSRGRGCMDLGLGKGETQEVQSWLKSQDSALGSQVSTLRSIYTVAVGVGSKMQSKLWPIERYQQVLERLVAEHQIMPVFFGGAEDASVADDLIHKLGVGLNACGKLSLRGSARALEECAFYLGNDTGTMHLAVATGLKCIAIFSARDIPGKWYPYGEGHKVHRVAVDCQGCMLYECHEEDRKCLMAVQPEEVYFSCVELIEQRASLS